LTNRIIARAQRRLTPERKWSYWSHAFLFQGRRVDDHDWVIESDMDIRSKHIRLGVQENRVQKYYEDDKYGVVAVLDLGLTEKQAQQLLAHALELVSAGTRYSLREIVGTVWAMRHPEWRPKENQLAREKSFYCSAFVRHVFGRIGLELTPGIDEKNTTPEDIASIAVPHTKWLMVRSAPSSQTRRIAGEMKERIKRHMPGKGKKVASRG
jgi:hypothetical protein